MLKSLAAEFKDGTFALPPLPDVEQAPLQVIGGVLRHVASGLTTRAPSTSGYYSTPDAPRDAVQAFLAPGRALSRTTNVSASLGHVGLNWTPKRHATTSPALVEVIQTTLLCSVADRAKPYSERSIARLPNRLLVHNVFSYLADINSVRVNKDMELDTSPPNGIYKAGGIQVTMPSLLIQQWTTELARHAPCLKVLVYEGAEATGGSGKGVCAKDLAEQDVVLMNFETLQSGAKP